MDREEPSAHSRLGELYIRVRTRRNPPGLPAEGDLALAEDLVQEAFVRMVGAFRHLRLPLTVDMPLLVGTRSHQVALTSVSFDL